MKRDLPPRFASDFGAMMMEIYGELCAEREQSPSNELVAVYRRAESSVNNTAAVIVMGSPEAIDKFCQEKDL